MTEVTIYHNPRCSKSRQTLELLNENGVDPNIVLYLEDTPSKDTLKEITSMLGVGVREIMRSGEDEYKEMNLADRGLTDDELFDALVSVPKIIQRPIVVANGKARIGRPPEAVLEIL